MPGLTATEKNHWRDRITARISRAVERIKARHPALFDRIARCRSAHNEQRPPDEPRPQGRQTPAIEPAKEA